MIMGQVKEPKNLASALAAAAALDPLKWVQAISAVFTHVQAVCLQPAELSCLIQIQSINCERLLQVPVAMGAIR